MVKLGVLVGSLRKEAYSKQIAENVVTLFPENVEITYIKMDQLPFYNQDFDEEGGRVPEEIVAFRREMHTMDAFLFVTPEYNRSFPALLKNALDVGSRPKAESVWNQKPAGIISQSPGGIGGFGANHHLRQVLTTLNMPVVQQPEVYLGGSHTLLENGKITNEDTVDFLQSFVDTFMRLIEKK